MDDQHDYFVDPDDEDDEEWDEENNDHWYLKYMFEGAPDLARLAGALRVMAAEFDTLRAEGWYLTEPVAGGHVHMRRESAVE